MSPEYTKLLIDAPAAGKQRDDRVTPGGHRAWIEWLMPRVKRLKTKHADKHPTHYTKEGEVEA